MILSWSIWAVLEASAVEVVEEEEVEEEEEVDQEAETEMGMR